MKFRKFFASSMIGLLLAGQLSTVALAVDSQPAADPTTASAPADSQTPSSTPAPSDASAPAATTPDPAQVTPPAAGSGSATTPVTGADPSTTGAQGATGADPSTTGAQGPTGATVTPSPTTGPADTTGKKPEWVFNTLTGKWETADADSFTWDKTTGYWLSPKYVYDTRMGWYKIVPPADNASSTAPSYYITAPMPPEIVHTPVGDFVKGSPEYNLAKSLGIIVDPAISFTGPNSTNNASVNNSTNALVDFTNIVKLANVLNSAAMSGSANVSGNTNGGNSQSGDAIVMANVVNLLNSVWNLSGGAVVTFVKNIFGNFFGDITISAPDITAGNQTTGGGSSSTNTTGPNSNNNATLNNSNNLKVNVANQGTIDNTIDLSAASGSAEVAGNTKGGNATSGDATVALNLINMINSAISAGGGFVGILNVFGNFNGDVLFGNDFLTQVVQSGSAGSAHAGNSVTGPNSTNNSSVNSANNLSLVADNKSAINNDITAKATSGVASDSNNNTGGNANSGSADTHSSVANVSGQNVSGDNAVLVIVNVMGHWLGGIMSLPGNITSALLGSADSTATNNVTGPGSSNNSTVNNTNNADYSIDNDMAINNHVKLNAQTGSAGVDGNTIGGNATTGNAKVLSSVANITNSALNLRRWFGILIINVFGDWTGAVGRNTSAGDAAAIAAATAAAIPTSKAIGSGAVIVHTSGTQTQSALGSSAGPTAGQAVQQPVQVLAAAHDFTAAQKSATNATAFMFIIAAAILMLAALLGAAERKTRVRI